MRPWLVFRVVVPTLLISVVIAVKASASTLEAAAPPIERRSPPELPLSSVRVPLAISLEGWQRALDGTAEPRVGSQTEYEPYPDDLELRWWVERDPLAIEGNFDTLWIRQRIYYGLDLRGDFGRARCPEEGRGIGANADLRVQVGLDDEWGLDLRVTQLPIVYDFRCKPRPPGVNFNRFFAEKIQEHMVDPRLEFLAASKPDSTRDAVSRVWEQVQRPIELGAKGAWLWFDPQDVVIEPLRWEDGLLRAEAQIRVRARFLSGQLPELIHRSLPPARVRLTERDLQVSFDCRIPTARIEGAVREAVLGATVSTEHATVRIEGARVRTGGDRIAVELTVRGDLEGPLHLTGRLHFDSETRTVRVVELGYAKATMSELFEQSSGALRLELDNWRARIEDALDLDAESVVVDRLRRIGHGLNSSLGDGIELSGGAMRLDTLGFFQDDEDLVLRLAARGRVEARIGHR